jgi:hypothetical protein
VRGYATNLALVAALCIMTLVAYLGLTLILGVYDDRDRALFKSFVRR